jgi:hypothetical protein
MMHSFLRQHVHLQVLLLLLLLHMVGGVGAHGVSSSLHTNFLWLLHMCRSYIHSLAAAADLPALQAVGQDLQADAGLVAASVAIYMLTVGLGSLFWGPMVGYILVLVQHN